MCVCVCIYKRVPAASSTQPSLYEHYFTGHRSKNSSITVNNVTGLSAKVFEDKVMEHEEKLVARQSEISYMDDKRLFQLFVKSS
ncbi:Uncharacterized protein BM_BM13066 [Brugia malayi]|uniref:Bm13066 n=1 Tax=Brugia malayi TaxID=6279 RepID=A0A0J9YBE6_BRUMA|nr:Uncharacterized protein BM_BM13066 [Brugia malayi]CDQ05880.1 Bm13066 [Brugia malayi]VIP00260.1 Uncharacterized protein BM_BM13066 [Brugia malayi]